MKLIAGFSEMPSCCCGEGLRDHGGSGDQLGGGCRVQAETGVASRVVALETDGGYILEEE